MLREDLLGPARDELNNFRTSQFQGVSATRLESGAPVLGIKKGKDVTLRRASEPCVMMTFSFPKNNRYNKLNMDDRVDYWDRCKTRILPHGALVVLRRPNPETGEVSLTLNL